jgi:hypothetical protein
MLKYCGTFLLIQLGRVCPPQSLVEGVLDGESDLGAGLTFIADLSRRSDQLPQHVAAVLQRAHAFNETRLHQWTEQEAAQFVIFFPLFRWRQFLQTWLGKIKRE